MVYQCLVCGFPGLHDPPRSAVGDGGSYEICPSCGFEFGVTDDDLGYTYDCWRQNWIDRGTPWASATRREPEGWDAVAQLDSLPK